MTTAPESTATPTQNTAEKKTSRWPKRLAIGIAALVFIAALFGILGYFWLPGFAKSKLENLLTEQLHRPVTIGAIHVAPYTLEATVENIKVGDVLRVKSLYVDVSAQTLIRRLPVISAVRLVSPELTLTRVASDRLDVSDLLDEWLNKPDDGKPTPGFSVSNIRLEGGRIVWHDKLAQRTDTLSEITISLPVIANVPAAVETFIHPLFAAKLNGSPLILGGKARPFNASQDANLQLDLDNFDLTATLPYLRPYLKLPITIDRLLISTQLDIQFAKAGEKVGAGGTAKNQTALGITGDVTFNELKSSLLNKHVLADMDALQLRKISVDVLKRQVRIGEIILNHPTLALLREGEDSFVFPKTRSVPSPVEKVANKTHTPQAPKPWQWLVQQITLNEGQVNYRDTSVAKSLPITISPLTLSVGPISSDTAQAIAVQLNGELNQKGHVNIAGEVTQTGQADLSIDVSHLDLVALQGWVSDQLPVLLTQGDLDFKGQFEWRNSAGKTKGNLALNQINLLDKTSSEDLLRWQSLNFSGLEVAIPSGTQPAQPLAANLGNIDLKNFFAKVLLTKEGKLNLNQLATANDSTAQPPTAPADAVKQTPDTKSTAQVAKPAPPLTPAPVPASTTAAKPAPNIRIGRITFTSGTVDFTDHFIQPNYATQITQLNGHVDPIKAGTLSAVSLHGKVERTAPLDITGQIDPLSHPIGLALHATARSIELAPLSSYSGRYVGYKIDKGKLSVEVDYKINQGQLEAKNHIFLDQLTFGDKVESRDALSIPVNLAVALLRNSRGEIDINLPISGSLNDPQFSIGGIIWQVLGNLLVKAVTSPFALIGSLFGSGEDLSEINFPAGQSIITPEMTARLETLAKALADRPALKLEITGVVNEASDKTGFSQTALDKKMRNLKQAELAGKGQAAGTVNDVSLSPEETTRYLEKVYKKEDIKDKPRNLVGLNKSLPETEMKTRLLAHLMPTESDLLALADARAQQVHSWLVDQGKVAPERIFLRSPKTETAKTIAVAPPVAESVDMTGTAKPEKTSSSSNSAVPAMPSEAKSSPNPSTAAQTKPTLQGGKVLFSLK